MITSVPNVSEGRDPAVLTALAAAAQDHCHLLEFDAGGDANRTVLTLAGGDLVAANLALARIALASCDLRTHSGIHVRMGAVDVIPYVDNPPHVAGDAANIESMVVATGAALAADHALPVFRYGIGHRPLRAVRRQGFEVLPLTLAAIPPTWGPADRHPTGGATAVGVRRPLVAFNVCLASADVALANRVARAIRASSGGLPEVMAIGWATPGFGCVQVSMNLTDWPTTPPHVALEAIRHLAPVLGSELVGMIPRGALSAAAGFYGVDLEHAAQHLGLDHLAPFHIERKVLEERLSAVGLADPLSRPPAPG